MVLDELWLVVAVIVVLICFVFSYSLLIVSYVCGCCFSCLVGVNWFWV